MARNTSRLDVGLKAASGRGAEQRLQVLGLCRFSYLGEGGFRLMHGGTLEQRAAALFDPQRMALRMVWFEQVCLPSIAAQTDGDFALIVLVSDQLPGKWRARLESMTRGVPQIRIVCRAPGPHRQVCHEVIRETCAPDAAVCAQFRLDDDDAVAVDFVARLRSDADLLRALRDRYRCVALDYTRGVILRDEGGALAVTPRIATAWAAGLVLLLPAGHPQSVLDFPHHKIGQRMAHLTLADSVMFVRGVHGDNDSEVPDKAASYPVPADGPGAWLADRFRIDLGALRSALTTLRGGW